MISVPGVGSGLEINAITEQLMAIECRTLDRLEQCERPQLDRFYALDHLMGSYRVPAHSLPGSLQCCRPSSTHSRI